MDPVLTQVEDLGRQAALTRENLARIEQQAAERRNPTTTTTTAPDRTSTEGHR